MNLNRRRNVLFRPRSWGFAALLMCSCAAHGTTIPVLNAGFETAALSLSGNGTFSQLVPGSTIFVQGGTLADWTVATTNADAAAGGFAPSNGYPNWSANWWTGNNIGYLQQTSVGTVSLSQVLSTDLANDTTYTLGALIGRRAFTPTFNYLIELFAGSNQLASASNLNLLNNTFGADSLTYASGSNNLFAGQHLMIRFSATAVGAGQTEAFFDNVTLDAVATPEPSSLALALLGAAALIAGKKRKGPH